MSALPSTHRFTVDEYERMAHAGIFHEDDRVELIDGQVVEMTPIGPRHAACVDRLNRILQSRVGERAVVRVQSPVVLGRYTAPQPDIALLRPPLERYAESHPGVADILLLVEVAQTSLDYDRSTKLPAYAREGVAEVWLVDLENERVEVYRDPMGESYATITSAAREGRRRRAAALAPLALPGLELTVADVLG